MKSFKDIQVWNKAYNLVLEIYKLTKHFPQEEKFGLTQQMRRSAVSIIANIAEGNKRKSDKDFEKLFPTSEEIGRMLQGFIKALTA